ncbi:anaphase-promoting complex subunit CDC26-like [Belonocnema kinseyi]|uniref:anaphase-promoting complex subunit CDC26-like n=1 Tax=Belonocnema kinseyi TaxID=2817044 RepID=UPI00143D6EEB|nr:anaphase-promoting complex subunit CDC26-like [Belonocnema kinseyi]XP_033208776.1 anaphase-promoting complex subunit CDC26-like [Belonocnema kinseyi]
MLRRSPTRIDLRVDDLAEYDQQKKEREAKKDTDRPGGFNPSSWAGKMSQNEIQERIGYVPQPPQSTHERHNI